MKTLIILCLWGTSLSAPVWPGINLLSASNSREMQMMQLQKALGNSPQQTQLVNPGFRLPPAQIVPDQATLQLQQDPNQDPHHQPAFGNPVISAYQQLLPSINLIPLTSLMTPGQDIQPQVNPSAGHTPITQTLPIMIGGINALPQMLPQQAMYPIIVAQIGQQDMIISSEEMEITQPIFTGIFMPPFLPELLPVGQAGVSVDGQDTVISVGADTNIPAGQTGANTAVTNAVPDGTLNHNEQEMLVTVPAGVRKSETEGNIVGEGNRDRFLPYTTASGLVKPPTESVTDVIFVEPTALVDTAPNEANRAPYSELNVALAPWNGKLFHSNISQGQKLSAPARGDDHQPLRAKDAQPLRNHMKRRA